MVNKFWLDIFFFFSSRRRHTRLTCDWSSDVCSSDLVYAEDPDQNFFPSPGKITRMAEPSGPGVRLDSGVYVGFAVPMDYDPLLAKLAVWGGTREDAIERMSRALGEYHVAGIRTNLALFRRLLADPFFREGRLDTGFIDAFLARSAPAAADVEL